MGRTFNIFKKVVLSAGARLALQPFKFMPVKHNRVLFSAYLEKQYACNPRYISEELERLYGDRIEIGWAFRHPEEFEYLKKRGIRVLPAKGLEFIRFALSTKVVCTNTYYKPSLPRRKKQFYMRTWHGGGAYKKVGSMQEMPFIERIFIGMQQSGADVYLSSSSEFTRLTLRESFGYKGEVMEIGMPRNDMLVNPPDAALIKEIKAEIGIPDDTRIALYAPTYRKDTAVHQTNPDYAGTAKALEARFGGKWVFIYRSHHVTMYKSQNGVDSGAVDVTAYPDMQRLLLASDVLITDYSSSIWDMSLSGKPVFLYAPDLEKYTSERDFYTDIRSWPFPLSQDQQELDSNIARFDEAGYKAAVKRHHDELGSCETGRAATLAARRIGKELRLEN